MNVNPNKHRPYYYHNPYTGSGTVGVLVLHPTKQDSVDEWCGALHYSNILEEQTLKQIIQDILDGFKILSYYPKSECYKTLKQAQDNER